VVLFYSRLLYESLDQGFVFLKGQLFLQADAEFPRCTTILASVGFGLLPKIRGVFCPLRQIAGSEKNKVFPS